MYYDNNLVIWDKRRVFCIYCVFFIRDILDSQQTCVDGLYFIFGLYPIIKALCEKGFPIYVEFFLKLLYYNLALIILYFMFKLIIKEIPHFKFGLILTLVSSEVIFILYDYLLTLILQKIKSLKIFGGANHD